MAYIPDPTNITQPTEEVKASTAAAEFRALKSYIATLAGLSPPSGLGAITISQLNGGQLAGMRNKIINGKMEIAQRGTSFPAIAAGAYSLDRWSLSGTFGTAVFTVSQQADVPPSNEFQSSLRAAVTTADTSIGPLESAHFSQPIEGFNVRDLIGRAFTISFWVRSSTPGVHCIALRNSGTDRSYVSEYTVSSANTWEYKTITVLPGLITAGVWNWGNGVGLFLTFSLAAGSSLQTTPGAWQTGNFLATANQVNCLGTAGNIFAITGVQLEVGTVATPFEHRPIGAELALCERYYERGDAASFVLVANITSSYPTIQFSAKKRAIPTMTLLPNSGTGAALVPGVAGCYQSANHSIDSASGWIANAEL